MEDAGVYLSLFTYGGVHPDTVTCLLRDLPRITGKYHPASDADVYRCRSKVASAFILDGECDVLLMVDHDMSWSQGTIERLISLAREHRGIVGAICPKRGMGAGVATRFLSTDDKVTVPEDTVIHVSAVGAALTAIHADVLNAVKGETMVHEDLGSQRVTWWPIFQQSFTRRQDESGAEYFQYNGEDFDLCTRARDAGFPVLADCQSVVRHHGDYGFTLQDATKCNVL